MENQYIKKESKKLTGELRAESVGAMTLGWVDSYKDTKYSIRRIERLKEYVIDKGTPSEIGWFVFLVVVVSAMHATTIYSLHIPGRQKVFWAILGVLVIIALCFLGRFLFYHAIERRLIFAENRRLTHENKYPGISNLVLDYLNRNDDSIPPSLTPAFSITSETNPIDEDFEVNFDKEEINLQIEESLMNNESDDEAKDVTKTGEVDEPEEIETIDGAAEADEVDEVDGAAEADEVDEVDEAAEVDEVDEPEKPRVLFTGEKTIIVVYPKNLRDAIEESLRILDK